MSSLQNRILLIASLFGVTAISIGAMGAHFLKDTLTAEQLLHIETGARYQMYHAIVLMGLSVLAAKIKKGYAQASLWFFALGIVCFSFSLYAITVFEVFEISIPKFVFFITPLGGLLLMVGWGSLLISPFKNLYIKNAKKNK